MSAEPLAIQELLNIADYEDASSMPDEYRLTEVVKGKVSLKPTVSVAKARVVAAKYGGFLLFCDDVDDISDLLDRPTRPQSANHVMVSPHVDGTLPSLGIIDRPVTMTVRHVWTVMRPGTWEGGENPHHHGVDPSTLKRLPWLLERPALVANSKDDTTKLILALNATDRRGTPLVAPIKVDATGRLDVGRFISNLVCSLFGYDDFYDYFGMALKPKDIIYIDSKQEAELSETVGREVFCHLDGLARDTELTAPQILGDGCYDPFPEHDAEWLVDRVKQMHEMGRSR